MMNVKLLNDPSEMLKECKEFLSKAEAEAENCLIISLLNRLLSNKHLFGSEDPRFFLLMENDNLVSLAIQTPPFNLVLSHPFRKEGLRELVAYLKSREITLPGVIGDKENAYEFAKLWSSANNLKIEKMMEERIHQLRSVDQGFLPPSHLNFKLASTEDIDFILKWMHEFSNEALHEREKSPFEEFVTSQRANILEAIKDEQYYFLELEGKIVSMARTPSKAINGRLVNYVYTPKELRGNGYATHLVAKLSQKILDDGHESCMLFTDLSNPISNSIYYKIGYRSVLDIDMLGFH